MRRTLLSISLSAAAVLAAALPAAANFTDSDGNLRSELESRRDSLSSATDKAAKKQYKAVLKSLKFMDKGADDLGDDIKTAGKVAKTLQKAFPDEFTAFGVVDSNLHSLCNSLFSDLQDYLEEDLGDLENALGGLSEKGRAKVQKALVAAEAALDATDPADLPAWAKLLGKARKSWVKGDRTASKDKGPTAGYFVKVDGKKLSPAKETVVVVLHELTGQLVFNAAETKLGGYTVQATPGAVLGTGEKGISVGTVTKIDLPAPKNYAAASGTFTVSALDNEANTISFTFSFTADGTLATPGSVTVEGSYTGPFQSGSDPQ